MHLMPYHIDDLIIGVVGAIPIPIVWIWLKGEWRRLVSPKARLALLLLGVMWIMGCIHTTPLSKPASVYNHYAYMEDPDDRGTFLIWVATDRDLLEVQRKIGCPCTIDGVKGKFYRMKGGPPKDGPVVK